MVRSTLFALFVCLVTLPLSARSQAPAGTWDLVVDAYGDDHPMVLNLAAQGTVLGGTIEPDLALEDVQLSAGVLTFAFRNPEHGPMSVRVVVDGDALEGTITTDYGDFPMRGTRRTATAEDGAGRASESPSSFSTNTPLRVLLESAEARAVIDRHVPGLTSNPELQQALDMSLRDIAPFAPDTFTETVLRAMDESLAEL